MLNVGTLFTVFTVNFLALGVVWAYVATSYPNLHAARYWTAAALTAAFGTAVSVLRGTDVDPLIPIVLGGGLLLFATSLATIGMHQFYGRPAGWRPQVAIVGVSMAGLLLFTLWHDNMAVRVLIYSGGQSITVAMTVPLLLSRKDGGGNAGARLAGWLAIALVVVHAVRSAAALANIGGGMTFANFNNVQAMMVLVLVFLAMSWTVSYTHLTLPTNREV